MMNVISVSGSGRRQGGGGGGGGRLDGDDGGRIVAVEVGGDVVDVADLEAGGAVHRSTADRRRVVERRRAAVSTLRRPGPLELAGAAAAAADAVEVVVGGHGQASADLVTLAAARLYTDSRVRNTVSFCCILFLSGRNLFVFFTYCWAHSMGP